MPQHIAFLRSWGICLGLVLLVGGCSSKEQAPRPLNRPSVVMGNNSVPVVEAGPGRVVSANISPREPVITSNLTTEVEVEGDVSLTYSWRVGGEELVGESSDSLAGVFQRGDRVQVRVTPYRGDWSGTPVDAPAVVIRNSPPQLTGDPSPGVELDGFKLQAEDADGDAVSWRLSGGPPGLSLDSDGTFHYVPQAVKESREWTVEASASDGHGGTVRAGFSLVTRPGI